jgi:putative ABC transport system permease protein
MARRLWPTRPTQPAVPDDVEPGVDDEVRFHLQARAEELMAGGMPRDAARAQALREFGDLDDARRYMSWLDQRTAAAARRRHYMDDIRQDLRTAVRRLRAAPGFTIAAVLTIALGVGINAAVFSVVRAILLRPLPFPKADQLHMVYSANRTGGRLEAGVSPLDLDDWRARRQTIEDLGGYFFAEGSSGLDWTGHGDPRRLSTVFVTPGFFTTLGVLPVTGRLPREDEMVRGGHDRVAVLTYGFWQREFGGAPLQNGLTMLTMTLNGEPYDVVGVLPDDLRFPTEAADLFVPYSTIPDNAIPRLRQVRVLSVVARARDGVGLSGVRLEMSRITRQLAAEFPEDQAWDAATVVPLRDVVVGPVRDGLYVLFGAVGLVLLMACVNVAGLQLARAAARGREMAVRLALGARRSRLIRQLLTENVVLGILGGGIGLALAQPTVTLFVALSAGQLPRAAEITVDATVVAVTLGTSILVGILFGLIPALRGSSTDVQRSLQAGGRSLAGVESHRLRTGLVIGEVAVAMMLVVAAGLMVRSFRTLTSADAGFRPDHLIAVQFTINLVRHGGPPSTPTPGYGSAYALFYHDVIEKVRTLPGVKSAAAVKDPPFRGNGEINGFRLPGRPVPAGEESPSATVIHVSDGYFATIGAQMVEGREFTRYDLANAPRVFVVNEAFVRQFFPGERAVGKRLILGERTEVEIVGVVHDIRQVAMAEPARPTIYVHNLQNSRVKTTIVARTAGDPVALVNPIREAIWSIDPQQAITSVFTFDESVSRALARPRLLTILLGSFGALGLLLGAIGIYGVLAALVGERRREIGVRLALGATPSSVAGLILSQGVRLGLTGIVIGLGGALAGGRFVSTVLYGVRPTDPWTLIGVALVLLGAACAASWWPAHRAARLDPVETLRSE